MKEFVKKSLVRMITNIILNKAKATFFPAPSTPKHRTRSPSRRRNYKHGRYRHYYGDGEDDNDSIDSNPRYRRANSYDVPNHHHHHRRRSRHHHSRHHHYRRNHSFSDYRHHSRHHYDYYNDELPRVYTSIPIPYPSVIPADAFTARVLQLTNIHRAHQGVHPVILSRKLTAVARAHTLDQARKLHRISHIGSDGSSLGQRARRHGYRYRTVAENVASGQKYPDHVVRSWMRSKGHRKNIVRPDVDHMALWFIRSDDGRVYWTQLFGKLL